MNNTSQTNNDDINFSAIFSSIKRRKKSFLIIAFSLTILSGIYAFKKKSTWEGTFQIVLRQNQQISSMSSLLNTSSPISLLRDPSSQKKLNTEILILQSPSVLKPIYDYVKSEYNQLGFDTSSFKFREWKKNLLVKVEKKSNVLSIYYRDNQKKLVIPVLNQISEKYQEYSGRDRLKSLKKTQEYLNTQIYNYKDKTKESSRQLQAFSKLHNIGILPIEVIEDEREDGKSRKKSSVRNELMLDLESKFIGAKNEVELTDQKLAQLANIDKNASLNEKIAIFSKLDNSYGQNGEIKDQISKINEELVRYETGFNNEYPKIKNLELLKKETFKLLQEAVIGSLKGKRKEAIAIQNASKRSEKVISKYKELYRRAKLDLQTLSNLEIERNINALSLAKKNDPWQLISNPLLFDKPVLPNKPRIIFTGILFGIIFGTLFAKYKDKKSGLIYEKNDLDNFLNYKKLFDFSNIEEDKLDSIVEIFIEKYIIKENLVVLTLGDFSSKVSSNILELIKENKKKIQIFDDLKDIEDFSKVLILISLNNLSKKELIYLQKFFILKSQSDLFTAYI